MPEVGKYDLLDVWYVHNDVGYLENNYRYM